MEYARSIKFENCTEEQKRQVIESCQNDLRAKRASYISRLVKTGKTEEEATQEADKVWYMSEKYIKDYTLAPNYYAEFCPHCGAYRSKARSISSKGYYCRQDTMKCECGNKYVIDG